MKFVLKTISILTLLLVIASFPVHASRPHEHRAYLGVSARDHCCPDGAYVIHMSYNGPAKVAGLDCGDVITRIDGARVYSARRLIRVINRYEPGDKVVVEFRRGERRCSRVVILGKDPDCLNRYDDEDEEECD